MRRITVLATVCAAMILAPLTGAGESEGQAKMNAEINEMMEAYMAAGTPGEPHGRLAEMTGTWKFENTGWPMPGAEPWHSTGTATYEPILGGRFVREEVVGDPDPNMGGMSFHGIGFNGYDNLKDTYVAVWLDNMSTAIHTSEGTWKDDRFVFHGTFTDPVSGKTLDSKAVGTKVSVDKWVWTFYQTGADGEMFKSMEIVYTRGQ